MERQPRHVETQAAMPHIAPPFALRQFIGRLPGQPPAQRHAVRVAVAVATFTFLLLQLLHRLVAATGADFRAVLRGATTLATGGELYGPALRFLDAGHLRSILSMPITPYVYPPPLAMLLRPLTALPPALAQMLWDAVNVGLLAVLFVLVVRISRARSWRELFLVGAIYGFFPLDMGLGTGQVDLPIAVMTLLSYLLYRSGHLRRAGIVLGLLALIKPTAGVILIYFLCRRAWPVVSACVATLACGIGASLLAVGGSTLWEYRRVAAGWAGQFGVLPLNQSLQGFLVRLLASRRDVPPAGAAATLVLAIEAAVLVAAVALAARLLGRGEPREERAGALQFYAIFSLLLLVLPFTENLHLCWLLPGVGILFVMMAQDSAWRPWHAWAVGAYLVLALPFAELLAWRADASRLGRLASSIDCYGLLALTLVLAYVAFAGRHASASAMPRLRLLAGSEDERSRPLGRSRLLAGARKA